MKKGGKKYSGDSDVSGIFEVRNCNDPPVIIADPNCISSANSTSHTENNRPEVLELNDDGNISAGAYSP